MIIWIESVKEVIWKLLPNTLLHTQTHNRSELQENIFVHRTNIFSSPTESNMLFIVPVPWLAVLPGWSWPRSEGWWRGRGWGCGWPSSHHWSDTWAISSCPSPWWGETWCPYHVASLSEENTPSIVTVFSHAENHIHNTIQQAYDHCPLSLKKQKKTWLFNSSFWVRCGGIWLIFRLVNFQEAALMISSNSNGPL